MPTPVRSAVLDVELELRPESVLREAGTGSPQRATRTVRSISQAWRVAFGAVLLAASCSDSPTAPRTDALEVRSAVPAAGTVLTVGAQVGFTYEVTFSLTSNSALVGIMVIPVVGGISLFPDRPAPASTILRGTTTVTLSDTLTIPAGCTRVDVFIAMQNQDLTGQTSTVISYPVREQIQ